MELNVLNEQGQETAKVAASDTVFGREYNEALVHQLVVACGVAAVVLSRIRPTKTSPRRSTRRPIVLPCRRSSLSSLPTAVWWWWMP